MVDHLAAAFLHDDVNFLSIFLATYRTFVPPTQVVDMLLERYENLSFEESKQEGDESYSAADCEAIKVSSGLIPLLAWTIRTDLLLGFRREIDIIEWILASITILGPL